MDISPSCCHNDIEKMFGKYCVTALQNEKKQIFKEENKYSTSEKFFSEFTDDELGKLFQHEDEYEIFDNVFHVMQFTCIVKNDLLFEALSELPYKKRNVVILSFWMDLSDKEISSIVNTSRRNVSYLRHTALKNYLKF